MWLRGYGESLGYFDGFLGSTHWLGERLSGVPAPDDGEVAPRADTAPRQGISNDPAIGEKSFAR